MPAVEKSRRPFWFHPLLLAIFPGLSLLAANIDQIRLSQGIRLLAVSLAVGALVYLGAWLALRRRGNAALVASLILMALLTYGRLYDGLKEAGLSGETIVRHRYLIPVCLALTAAGVVGFIRMRETAALNRVLNVIAVAAVAFPLVSIGAYQANALHRVDPSAAECTLRPPEGQPLPDVYIIIMDGYERDDVLRELHGYDNSAFLQSLEAMGFYVARGSMSNFRPTEMSLSSLLNMAYVQDFPELFGARPGNQWDVIQLVNHSRVRRELECLGYTTVAFETGFYTEWEDADYYLERQADAYASMGLVGRVSRLEFLYLETTAGRALTDGWTASQAATQPEAFDLRADHRERILFILDQLHHIPAMPSPKLVFAHIISPHPPFVFGASGEPVELGDFETGFNGADWQLQAYADQVAYLNQLLLEATRVILEDSRDPPIIVMIGDHGYASRDSEEGLSNLAVYSVPASVELYQTITPVNVFRVIFDGVFRSSLGRLPDISYIYAYPDKFDLTVVPNTWVPSLP